MNKEQFIKWLDEKIAQAKEGKQKNIGGGNSRLVNNQWYYQGVVEALQRVVGEAERLDIEGDTDES